MLKTTLKDLLAVAHAEITTRTVEEVMSMNGREDVVLVDVRDGDELLRGGKIHGAIHASRGLLEMHVDPAHHLYQAVFAEDKEFVFY